MGLTRSNPTAGKADSAHLGMSQGYPTADRAPSNRAKCIACNTKISKADVRVVVEREVDTPYFTGKRPGYLHPGCVTSWSTEAGVAVEDVRATIELHSDLDENELSGIA